MCRTTDFLGFLPKQLPSSSLKINAFFIRFSGLKTCQNLPDSLTLHYLPPRVDGAELLVDGSNVKPDSPAAAMLTLHRVVNVKNKKGEAIFGSRERVQASGGVVRFEVCLGNHHHHHQHQHERILKGIMLKKEDEEWMLDCECVVLESNEVVCGGDDAIAVADLAVAVDGEMSVLSRRVKMMWKSNITNKRRRGRFDRLEVIPEERDESVSGSSDGEDDYNVIKDMDLALDLEWAVDLGIWVMCLGVGYLVSKASARSLRRFS